MINGAPLFHTEPDKADRLTLPVMNTLGNGEWWNAKRLCQSIEGLDRRTLREISERARGAIISDAKVGYKLNDFATKEERRHCENVFIAMSRKYAQKAVDVQTYPMKKARRA